MKREVNNSAFVVINMVACRVNIDLLKRVVSVFLKQPQNNEEVYERMRSSFLMQKSKSDLKTSIRANNLIVDGCESIIELPIRLPISASEAFKSNKYCFFTHQIFLSDAVQYVSISL